MADFPATGVCSHGHDRRKAIWRALAQDAAAISSRYPSAKCSELPGMAWLADRPAGHHLCAQYRQSHRRILRPYILQPDGVRMIPVQIIDEPRIVGPRETLATLDGQERAHIGVIRARGQAYALTYGIYLCADNPPYEEGKVAKRKPIEEWDFDPENPKVTYTLEIYVPNSVTRAQGKIALIMAGLWDAVVGFVNSIDDPIDKAIAEVALNDTLEWERDSEFLNTAAQVLGISSQDLDNLFISASSIKI